MTNELVRGPCNVPKLDGNKITVTMEDTVKTLLNSTEGVQYLATDVLKHHLVTRIHSENIKKKLDADSFMPKDTFVITEKKKEDAKRKTVTVLKSHYTLLNQLRAHIEHIRTSGNISKLASEAALKKKLAEITKKLDNIMCTIDIGTNDGTDGGNIAVSSKFIESGKTYNLDVRRTYVVLKDCIKLMAYLRKIYVMV